MTPTFEQLLLDADDPFFVKYPPSLFIKTTGLAKSSQEFILAAWKLFKEERRRLSKLEIKEYIEREKGINSVVRNKFILPEDPLPRIKEF